MLHLAAHSQSGINVPPPLHYYDFNGDNVDEGDLGTDGTEDMAEGGGGIDNSPGYADLGRFVNGASRFFDNANLGSDFTGSQPFTMAALIIKDNLTTANGYVASWVTGSNYVRYDGGNIRFRSNSTNADISFTEEDDEPKLIVWGCDGANIFAIGAAHGSDPTAKGTAAVTVNGSGVFRYGRYSTNYFAGVLGPLMIWDSDISANLVELWDQGNMARWNGSAWARQVTPGARWTTSGAGYAMAMQRGGYEAYRVTGSASGSGNLKATTSVPMDLNGHYVEFKWRHTTALGSCGVMDGSHANNLIVGRDPSNEGLGIVPSGAAYSESSTSIGTYDTWAAGDVVQFAVKNGSVWIGKNNTWMNSGDPAAGTGAIATGLSNALFPACSGYYTAQNNTCGIYANSNACTYTPPSGFNYWPGDLD